MIDCIDVIYDENDNELSWLIESGADCDENQVRLLHDWPYKCGRRKKQNRAFVTDQTRFGLWWKLDKIMMWLII